MIHLAMFMANLDGGGAERMMVHLASGLAARGVRVDLVLAQARGPFLDGLPASVRVIDLDRRSASGAIPALARYLRTERPDALLATLGYVSASAAIAHALAGGDALLFVREATTPSRRSVPSRSVKSRLVGWSVRWAYRRAAAVLAVSEGVAQDLIQNRGVPPARVTTVYNPVVTRDIAGLAEVDPQHPWLSANAPPVVLGVGSLRPEKDFPTLIAAFARLRAERSARLIILGEGPQRAELERLIAAARLTSDVDLPGFVANPFAYMSRASVFALSSVVEGLPGVLIQALACGCPVVATDCPSGPFEILEGGRFGPLVPVGDPEAMAAALASTIDAPPDRASLRQRSRAFDADRVVDAHLDVIVRAVANRRGGRRGRVPDRSPEGVVGGG